MTDVPRRLRPSPGRRANTILTQTKGAASAQGSTAASRPVDPAHAARQYIRPGGTPSAMSRWAALYRLDTTGLASNDKQYVAAWTVIEEDEGHAEIVPDDEGIGIYADGIYSVHLFVHGEGMQSADPTCCVMAFCDYFDPFVESFACSTRGGDPSSGRVFPSTSRTYYQPGTGAAALLTGLAWTNLDTVNVSQLLPEVQVQRVL